MRCFVAIIALVCTAAIPARTAAAPLSWRIEGSDFAVAAGRHLTVGNVFLMWGIRANDAVSPVTYVQLDAAGSIVWSREAQITSGTFLPAEVAIRGDDVGMLVGLGQRPVVGTMVGVLQRVDPTGALTTISVGPDVALGIGDSWLSAVDTTGIDSIAAVGISGLTPTHAWLVELTDLTVTSSSRIGDPAGIFGYFWWQVRPAPGGELYAAGKRQSLNLRHGGNDPWIVRLAADRSLIFQKLIETGLSSEIRVIAVKPGGGVLAAGTVATIPRSLWLINVDELGRAGQSTLYSADVNLSAGALALTPDGGALVAVQRDLTVDVSDGFLLRVGPAGEVLWTQMLAPAGRLQHAAIEPDLSCLTIGVTQREGLLASTDTAGSPVLCTVMQSVPLLVEDAPVQVVDTFAVSQSVAIQNYPPPGITISSPAHTVVSCDCAQLPEVVTRLLAVRQSVDAQFVWDNAAAALGYNVWTVTQRQLIDQARQSGSPPPVGVNSCSAPSPTPTASCRDLGAMNRTEPIVYYQVRALCGSEFEGP